MATHPDPSASPAPIDRPDRQALAKQLQKELMEDTQIHGFSILNQWEFQDPKMEVLSHIRPYVVGIFPYIGL